MKEIEQEEVIGVKNGSKREDLMYLEKRSGQLQQFRSIDELDVLGELQRPGQLQRPLTPDTKSRKLPEGFGGLLVSGLRT